LDVALETARVLDRPEIWNKLAQQALKQGNHKVILGFNLRTLDHELTVLVCHQVVETAYQRTKNFEKLSFLYLTTGSTDKLGKMQIIAEKRGDQMSRFHNALYSGDVKGRIAVLKEVGMCKTPLLYVRGRALTRNVAFRPFGLPDC
jgi:coatomer subunit alpha